MKMWSIRHPDMEAPTRGVVGRGGAKCLYHADAPAEPRATRLHVHVGVLEPLALARDVGLDRLPDGQLTGALADLRQVGAREAVRHLGHVVQVHVLGRGQRVRFAGRVTHGARGKPAPAACGRLLGQARRAHIIELTAVR